MNHSEVRRPKLSLTAEVTLLASVVTALSMAIYAGFQYFTMPGHTLSGLLLEHSWHVLALGGLTYAVLHTVLHHQIVKPIRALFLKCYAVTKGDLSPVSITTRVDEIREIADGINMMLQQLRDTGVSGNLRELAAYAEEVRLVAENPENNLTPASQDLLLELSEKLTNVIKVREHAP
ncbi:MAG: HAMP domain-containing protein [Kiritimatiellaeota bacterium]|nr:HAMP domain-containing protein [Kiritimatiellota bacterium]